jgi:multidrug efflux system membrane fusion protein
MKDQALIDGAKLDLVYCRITSPITGRVISRLVDPGNDVHALDTQGVIVITQLQPITVSFNMPEDDFQRVMKGTKGTFQLPVEAYDTDFNSRLATGTLLPFASEIDQTKHTVELKASFPNEDNALFPYQSIYTKLLVGTMHDAVRIPAAGVQRSSQGTFVYVVKPDQTVTMRSVVIGATQGDTSAISRGLNPGELVVVNGTDELRRGDRLGVQLAANPYTHGVNQ